MTDVSIDEGLQLSIDRINTILSSLPGGASRAAAAAMKRAGESARTQAGKFASQEYTVTTGTFNRNVEVKVGTAGGGFGHTAVSLRFAGYVLPLLNFQTRYDREGRVTTKVMRSGGASALREVFAARIFGPLAAFERVGRERFPVEQKFGPSTAHMMGNEDVQERMDKTIRETFEKRAEHEILRLMNGWRLAYDA